MLAGQDTDLKVYEADSGRLVCHFGVFDEQPIHGIHVVQHGEGSPGRALVWGSTSLAVFSIDGVEDGRRPAVISATAPDWVYCGRLSPSDPSVAVLATAHNEVVRLAIDYDAQRITVGDVISPARPILYSAEMAWTDDDCVLMVAGTAFGEILVWKCRFAGRSGGSSSHEMLFVLTGHEGSIYGVNISSPLTLPDGSSVRLLATCSDDRTVRIWDITERAESKKTYDEGHFSAARETGFSAILPDEEQPTMGAMAPVAVAMGHLSRIWGVAFAVPEDGLLTDAGLIVYSFGEDSTTQRWRLTVDDPSKAQLSGKLVYEKAISVHDGKHLWSHAISTLENNKIIATGGADSRISLIQEPLPRSGTSPQQPVDTDGLLTFDVPELGTDSAPRVPSKKPEALVRFDYISVDQLLVVTSLGRLLVGTFSDSGLQWKRLQVDQTFRDTNALGGLRILKRIAHRGAVLGTATGGIYFYSGQTETLSHVVSLPGKIADIILLNSGHRANGPESIDMLVYMFGNANPQHLLLDPATGNILAQEEIPGLDPRFVTASASRIGDYFIMGSRHGFLSVLRRVHQRYTKVLDYELPSRDTFTSIVPLPPTSTPAPSEAVRIHFLTTSRDGKYRIFEMEDDGHTAQIHLRHDSGLPFGPMIEGAWFTNDPCPELVLYGFRSKNFIVWNETRREERLSVDCGGGHRTVSLHHAESDMEPLRFAFNRAAKLYVFSQTKPLCHPLQTGTHGREIRALSSNGRYIATGSEDTSIRIWEYRDDWGAQQQDQRDMRCLASVKTHVTGIQTLKWLGEDYLFSSAGNEELFVWRLQRLADTGYVGLGIVCEGVFDDKSHDGDLRIMDFDVQQEPGDEGVTITMVFSSSVFRTYRYTPDGRFQLLARGAYTGACLTQVCHLGSVGGESLAVLTTSTDGHTCLWRTITTTTNNETNERVFAISQVVPLHQSSIKSLAMVAVDETTHCILTGGDDCALGLAMLTRDPSTGHFAISSRGIVRRAHAAAVNGVIAARRGDRILAVTVSNDQRIKSWAVTTTKDGAVGLGLLANAYSGVADPGDVEFLDGGRRVMVGGVGVEVWTVDS